MDERKPHSVLVWPRDPTKAICRVYLERATLPQDAIHKSGQSLSEYYCAPLVDMSLDNILILDGRPTIRDKDGHWIPLEDFLQLR